MGQKFEKDPDAFPGCCEVINDPWPMLLMRIILLLLLFFKGSIGEVNCLKRETTPDPPGLEPAGTLLVMSNALTTELWDQAEPRRRRQVFQSVSTCWGSDFLHVT